MNMRSCLDLRELIEILHTGDQSARTDDLQDDEYVTPMLEYLSSESRERIEEIMDWLQEDFDRIEVEYVDLRPTISILISYASCRLEDQEHALHFAKVATDLFRWQSDPWNEAISCWFLGMIYRNNDAVGEAKNALKISKEMLEKFSRESHRKYDYKTRELCQKYIRQIEAAINNLPGRAIAHRFSSRKLIPYGVFSDILQHLIIPSNQDFERLRKLITSLEPLDSESINRHRASLKTVLLERPEKDSGSDPMISILLAHCYNLGHFSGKQEAISYAMKYTRNAIGGFHASSDQWNIAISCWYLALLYQSISDSKYSLVNLHAAHDSLSEISKHVVDPEKKQATIKIQTEIQDWINKVDASVESEEDSPKSESPQDKNPPKGFLSRFRRSAPPGPTGPDPTPLTPRSFTVNIPTLRPKLQREKSSSPSEEQSDVSKLPLSGRGRSHFHITIPVDTQALLDSRSAPIPLNDDLINRLKEYNQMRPNRIQNPKKDGKKLLIPPITMYGHATAGTDGKVNLDELECANGVGEDYILHDHGRQFKVYSVKENDTKVTIIDGRIYGWLKVEGESMNMAKPVPIDDEDFVLFHKNDNFEACDGKIVIASHSGSDGQPPLIMVKRLVSRKEHARYFLYSESSLDVHKIPLLITEESQLIGEVIAIAKPTK